MVIRLTLLLLALGLVACGAQPERQATANDGTQCYEEGRKQQTVKLDLIRQLVAEGQYFSALAHLEQEQFKSDGARFLKAESLRKSGQTDAALAEYTSLKSGCLRALGYLGTGKIYALDGDLRKALFEIKIARDLLPTDANIRNDYGFVLLTAGEFAKAQQEFMTAIQLQGEHQVAIRNLVMALILDRKTDDAWVVADHHAMAVEDFQSLMLRAARFQREVRQNKHRKVVTLPDPETDQPILNRTGETL